jgi:hypothetical protein
MSRQACNENNEKKTSKHKEQTNNTARLPEVSYSHQELPHVSFLQMNYHCIAKPY